MLKDENLARLATLHNVAQFVSFDSSDPPRMRYALLPRSPSPPRMLADVVAALLASSVGTVNVRTFDPRGRRGTPFRPALSNVDDVIAHIRKFAAEGLYTIVNENIDVHDGGVSGVALGNVVEFAPDQTPRVVEMDGIAAAPRDVADRMLRIVYGPSVEIPGDPDERVEFSVHPNRVGHRGEHVTVWETERVDPPPEVSVLPSWPNRFSRLIGDKAFGLLVAFLYDLPVPATTVIGRRVAPFVFGTTTGTGEFWTRTCPAEQQPGEFTTARGWVDPFLLLAREDPSAKSIVSVLSQEGVSARWSGATLPSDGGDDLIEGVRGEGALFMLGQQERESLPTSIVSDVRTLLDKAHRALGLVRIEWAHDGVRAWVLQLHVLNARTASLGQGTADHWVDYDPRDGLDYLQEVVDDALATGAGVTVTRPVGVTSHVGDLLRRARVPARFLS